MGSDVYFSMLIFRKFFILVDEISRFWSNNRLPLYVIHGQMSDLRTKKMIFSFVGFWRHYLTVFENNMTFFTERVLFKNIQQNFERKGCSFQQYRKSTNDLNKQSKLVTSNPTTFEDSECLLDRITINFSSFHQFFFQNRKQKDT